MKPERVRLFFLFGAWALSTMFGGYILSNAIATLIHFLPLR